MQLGERRIQLALRGGALLLLALVITAIGLLSALASAGRELDDLRVQNAHAVDLATQLRQESDDLTRMARLYAVSGDERFRAYFNEILDIRNGDAPRPEGYAWVYWDFVLPEGERPSSSGEAMSLAELRDRAGLTTSEAALLAEAEANSNSLVDLERHAFEAVAVGDRETAIALLHGVEYLRGKASIMSPIAQTYAEVVESRRSSIQNLENQRDGLEIGLYAVLGIAVAAAAALAGATLAARSTG